MKTTNFANAARKSPLSDAQWMGTTGKTSKKKGQGAMLLPLTSLVDAFSIIVIYLLIGTQGGGLEADIPANLKLPSVENMSIIDSEMPTVRIQKGLYYIDNKMVAVSDLAQKLSQLKRQSTKDGIEILIQADTTMDYADLDPLLRAGSAAGIQKLKFAVTPSK